MSLMVTVEPTSWPVSLADARKWMRVGTPAEGFPDDDALITMLIGMACRKLQHELQRAIGEQTFVLQYDAFPPNGAAIRIPMPPTLSIDTLEYVDADGVTQTMAAQDYYHDEGQEPGWILPATDDGWPDTEEGTANAVKITFQAGYTDNTIPETLKVMILSDVATMYENRESASDRPPSKNTFVDRVVDHLRVPVI